MTNWRDFQRKHIQKADEKFVSVDGDPDFSLEHNNQVVAKTLENAERMKRQRQREHDEGIKERAWAAANYIKSGKTESVEKYFGTDYMNYLKGQELLKKYEPFKNVLRSHYGAKEETGKTESVRTT